MIQTLLAIIGLALGTIRYVVDRVTFITGVVVWVTGWVLAQGFWSTLAVVVFPPWGWYLLAERLLAHFGV